MNSFLTTLTEALAGALATAIPASPPHVEGDFWMPPQASTVAKNIDLMFMLITWLSYFCFAVIGIAIVYFVVKYRQRGKEILTRGPTHHTGLEVTWTIIPTIIVVFMFYFGFKGYLELTTPPANAYQIDVTAQQWSWTFKYPTGVQSDDLYVPVDKAVKLVMRSEDVLHSLYIPDFRVKKDVVPGRYTQLWFQAPEATGKEKGRHLFCAEYCGKDHSKMNRKVFVLSQPDFDDWMKGELEIWNKYPKEEHYWRLGPRLYKRCQSCHTLDGTPSTGPSWGPRKEANLPNIWERTSKGLTKFDDGKSLADLIGPGREFEVPEDYIRNSILTPNRHIVSTFTPAMPTFQGQLQDVQIQCIIDYMKHLDEFDAKGNWTKEPPTTPDTKKTADASRPKERSS